MGLVNGSPELTDTAVRDLATQRAAGQTALVTPAARDAAVALAAGSILGPVTLTATSNASSGSAAVVAKSIDLTVNQTGTASGVSTALKVNVTETAALGQVRLLDLQVGGTSRWTILGTAPIVSAANATWDAFKAAAFTQNFKGNTRINSQISKMAIYAPTLASDTATLTIDKAATLYISGPPVAGTNVSITAPAALIVASGRVGIGTSTPAWDLVVGDSFDPGGTSVKRLILGDASGNGAYMNIGKAWNLNLEFGWSSVTSSAKVSTYGNATPLNISASTVVFQGESTGNVCIGATAAGANANKCLALSNAAVSPTASANLAHVYAKDHNGAADSAALALYQEVSTVTAGDNTADRYVPVTVNGVALWLLARASAPA